MNNAYAVLQGSDRRILPGAVAKGPANVHATIEVSLKLRRKEALPAVTQRPNSVMTRELLGDTYGASQSDIENVLKAFAKFGLKPVEVNAATRTVRLRGPVAAMESAFQVKLFNYAHFGGDYRGRVGPLSVPAEVKSMVEGVFGLDNRQVARRRRQPVRNNGNSRSTSVPSDWFVPGELASRYNFPPGDGSGQTVGVLEFGGGYFPSDLHKFCSLAKIAAPPKVTTISTDGTSTDSRDGDEGEVMLDVEVIAGVCPKAHIVVYFAQYTEQGWITALDAAVHDQQNDPGVLSISWGNAEDTDVWTEQAMKQVNSTLQEATLLGVTVCIAAGDDGSSGAVSDGLAHANFPASSPFVLSVGGTTVPSKEGNQPDIVWKEGDGLRADNGGCTGGGVSSVFPLPDWQRKVAIKSVNPGAIEGRCIPDLAANADWTASPYLLVVDGKPQPNGGTSAASPLVASMIALINADRPVGKRVGYVTPVLYQTSQDGNATIGELGCTDVRSGNNTTDRIGGYSAGPGYDAASGWGTPNGVRLAQAIP